MSFNPNCPFPYNFISNEVFTPNPLTQLNFVKRLSDENLVRSAPQPTSTTKTQPEPVYETQTIIKNEPSSSGKDEVRPNRSALIAEVIRSLTEKANTNKDLTKLPPLEITPDKNNRTKVKIGRPRIYDDDAINARYVTYKKENRSGPDKTFYDREGLSERQWYRVKAKS